MKLLYICENVLYLETLRKKRSFSLKLFWDLPKNSVIENIIFCAEKIIEQ